MFDIKDMHVASGDKAASILHPNPECLQNKVCKWMMNLYFHTDVYTCILKFNVMHIMLIYLQIHKQVGVDIDIIEGV